MGVILNHTSRHSRNGLFVDSFVDGPAKVHADPLPTLVLNLEQEMQASIIDEAMMCKIGRNAIGSSRAINSFQLTTMT